MSLPVKHTVSDFFFATAKAWLRVRRYSEILNLATDEAARMPILRLRPETSQEKPHLATSNSLFFLDSLAPGECKAVAVQVGHYDGKVPLARQAALLASAARIENCRTRKNALDRYVDLSCLFFQALLLCLKDRHDLRGRFREALGIIADGDFCTDIKPSAFYFWVPQGKYLLSEIYYEQDNFPAVSSGDFAAEN